MFYTNIETCTYCAWIPLPFSDIEWIFLSGVALSYNTSVTKCYVIEVSAIYDPPPFCIYRVWRIPGKDMKKWQNISRLVWRVWVSNFLLKKGWVGFLSVYGSLICNLSCKLEKCLLQKARLPTVTTIVAPHGYNWKEITNYIMKTHNIEISGGLGPSIGLVREDD